jgi:hypothetical protein
MPDRRNEEGMERKPEVAAVMELYKQRAEAARQRRRDQHQAATKLLASIADLGECFPECLPLLFCIFLWYSPSPCTVIQM